LALSTFLKQHEIGELHKIDEFTPIEFIILQIIRFLSKFSNFYYVIYLSKYFILIPLFSMLRKENIDISGITRFSGTDFSALLIILRKNWFIKLEWELILKILLIIYSA
jgi:hypothetical protein